MASNQHQFFSIPAKRAYDVNLSTPIKAFIKTTFGDKEDYLASVDELNILRVEALLRENHKEGCSKLLRYLRFIFGHFIFS
jgi:hypothetical protein